MVSTSLDTKFSKRLVAKLKANNINSIEQVVAAYPLGLLNLPGFGMMTLRKVEAALFPQLRYVPDVSNYFLGKVEKAVARSNRQRSQSSNEAAFDDLLPSKLCNLLMANGVTSINQIIEMYPIGLIQITGLGMKSLRLIEDAFLDSTRYYPTKMRKIRRIKPD